MADDIGDYLAQLEDEHQLPEGILNAVMQTESGGNPRAVSPKGAMGPFQFMKATAQQYGVANPFDVKQSAEGAAKFLQDNLSKFGSVRAALAAYNAGPAAVQKAGGNVPNYPETQDYVQKVDAKMPALDPNAVKWDDEKGSPASQQPAQDAPDPSKVVWDDQKTPAATQQAPSFMDQLTRQLGLTARAAGHGLANAAGTILNPVNATINSAGRAMGFDPGLSTQVDQLVNNTVNANTPQPQGQIENAVQGVGAAIANPLSYVAPGTGATTITGAAARGIGSGIVGTAVNDVPQQGQNPQDYLKQLALGGAAGGALGAAGGIVGRAIAGANVSPEARTMMDEGVTLTPGQLMPEGQVGHIERAATSIPILGPTIQNAKQSALEDMNRAVYARALAPVGGQVPETVGRDAVDSVAHQLGANYDALLPNLTMRADAGFAQDMAPVAQVVARMPDQWRDRFNNLLNDNILARTTQMGQLTGEDLQKAQTALSQEASRLARSSDPWAQDLVEQVNNTQQAVRDALARQNPQFAPQLNAINQGYANFAILRKAAATAKENGPFTANALSQAVKSQNNTVASGGYARGNALMQDLSDAAQRTLGNVTPDSGTPTRHAVMHILTGGALGGAAIAHPVALAGPAAAMIGYGTDAGRAAMLAAIARRPELARVIGNGIVNNAGLLGGIGGAGYVQSQQPPR